MDQLKHGTSPKLTLFNPQSLSSSSKSIRLGICAMNKKVNSKHMQNILNGLKQFDEFNILIFTESQIFDLDVNDWPVVEAMIIFFSNGFPYSKGLKYIQLRNPFLINDFEMQKVFWDRRLVLNILKKENIPTPNNIIIDRGEEINNDGELSHFLNDSADIEQMIKNLQGLTRPANTVEASESFCSSSLKKNDMSTFSFVDNDSRTSIFKKNTENYDEILNDINSNKSGSIKNNNINIHSTTNNNSTNNNKDNNSSMNNNLSNSKSDNNSLTNNFDLENELVEYDDHIEFKGAKIVKPFVEKPFNGDDHNIYIYYPPVHGGGQKRLFRKTKELCSLFVPNENAIRRDKSYIYEEFLQTDGFDIKVYTIGPEYAHAEARKSPSLDGKVQRSNEGKEVRYPVNLTPHEKELARKIVKIFKQNICGFDILRAKGNSYVCDINGWSFVKGNKKYYEDCAILIRKMILEKLDQKLYLQKPIYLKNVPIYSALKLPEMKGESLPFAEELRSVVTVFRHADRSPKQKMKLVVNNPEILSLFDKFGNVTLKLNENKETVPHYKEIKLKKPKELMEVLTIVTNLLIQNKVEESSMTDLSDNFFTKLFQIKMVLEKNLNFEGMTRKIQMKPLKIEEKISPISNKKTIRVSEALMIIKWGGNLTHAGIDQAKLLGNTFRVQMYPSVLGDGSGLLRLHSTYRHDLKCYSSDEGRCLKTAAAFLQGFLQLEGPMIPIISSMVRKDEPVSQTLDVSCEQIPEVKSKIKHELSECLHTDGKLLDKFNSLFDKSSLYQHIEDKHTNYPLYHLLEKIDCPLQRLNKVLKLMDKTIERIKSFLSQEEIELESNSYFIKSVDSIKKRNFILKNKSKPTSTFAINLLDPHKEDKMSLKQLIEEEQNAYIEDYQGVPSPKWKAKAPRPSFNQNHSSFSNLHSLSHTAPSINDLHSTSSANLKFSFHDCEDEKIILIVKRYIKLRKDFYNTKTNKFDISKVPDIYDNIKYDIIHNRGLLDENGSELFVHINLLANFVMPLEYGITIKEKMNIGIKVIGALLDKIHKDLVWWNYTNTYYPKKEIDESDVSYSGLDQSRIDSTEIKSSWRHVKTRFYFTCASHMYSLLNLLSYGYDSFLLDQSEQNKKGLKELRNVFDLDYCSHVIFRLYENFNVGKDDPKRFRLEIIMSPGSTKDPREATKEHMINVSPWIVLNNKLTLQEVKEFFGKFMLSEPNAEVNA